MWNKQKKQQFIFYNPNQFEIIIISSLQSFRGVWLLLFNRTQNEKEKIVRTQEIISEMIFFFSLVMYTIPCHYCESNYNAMRNVILISSRNLSLNSFFYSLSSSCVFFFAGTFFLCIHDSSSMMATTTTHHLCMEFFFKVFFFNWLRRSPCYYFSCVSIFFFLNNFSFLVSKWIL